MSFDTFIPIETVPLPPAPPFEPPTPAQPTPQHTSNDPLPFAHSVKQADTEAFGSESAPASTTNEEPAPVLSDATDSSAWSLLSGHGTKLNAGRLARSVGAGAGPARNTSLEARDLSRPATAPHLQPYVDRNFPVAARLARAEGKATVSATIRPDGTPTDIRVVHVDPHGRGFGETCTRTLHHGPAWKPELNRDGRPVSSQVTYTCRFELPKDVGITTDAPTSGAGANRVWTKPAGG